MKCANCGAELKIGCVYCSVCGHEAQIVPDYNIFEDEMMKAILEEEQQGTKNKTTAQTQEKNAEAARKNKKKKRKQTILILSISLAVLVVILIGVILGINKMHDNSFSYQFDKGMSYAEEMNYTKALKYLEHASSLDSENTDVLIELAQIYDEREDYTSEEASLLQVLTLDDTNQSAYKLLIALYDKQKKYDAILSLYENLKSDKLASLFANYVVLAPKFSLDESETYHDTIEVELSATNEYTIYYTTDGTSPIENGEEYKEPITFDKEGEFTLKAVCLDDRNIYSEIAEAEYTIKYEAPDKAKVTPAAGTYETPQSITIEVPEGATAYYTWDNSTPNRDTSAVYSEPLDMPEGNNVLAVLIVDSHGLASTIAKFNYIYQP